jgi:hypothetical protein
VYIDDKRREVYPPADGPHVIATGVRELGGTSKRLQSF